ncbi:ATP-binding protein [Streptomyces sp. NA04227]|uniref:ATP-binding protein n=1 Tax=Streptomyces sp. NA04227 TaxID=2742136 RepID=UPI001591809E|nr:ATP-binding protein [Streptomyces sp. NA04227]QKW08441.1 ATP-binding protein [Streptomyces sp. NA04227]
MTVSEKGHAPVRTLLERKLVATPEAVAELRRAVREVLDDREGAAQLCVSEMVTNVISHLGAGTPVTLRVTADEDGIAKVALTDPEPCRWPVVRSATDEEETGRGLALLDAVSLRWGVAEEPDRKTVWCELRGWASGSPAPRNPAPQPRVL